MFSNCVTVVDKCDSINLFAAPAATAAINLDLVDWGRDGAGEEHPHDVQQAPRVSTYLWQHRSKY